MANRFLDWLPGAISKRFRGRSDKKRGQDAVFTLPDYERLLDEFILHHNSTFRPPNAPRESFQADGQPRTAFELMLWGFKNRGAANVLDADAVRLCLYDQIVATVDPKGSGLNIDGAFYKPLQDVPGLRLDREAAGGSWTALRDRGRLGTAWLLTDNGTSVVELTLVDPVPLSEFSVEEWKAARRQRQASTKRARDDELVQRTASVAVLTGITHAAARARGKPSGREPSEATRDQETRQQSVDARARIEKLIAPEVGRTMAGSIAAAATVHPPVDPDEDDDEALEPFRAARAEINNGESS